MPLTNYLLLREIGYGTGEQILQSETKRILDQFNLFGFIIHDPSVHIEFDKQLGASFEKLDYITGNKFLFFALTNPPAEWIEKSLKPRDYFSVFNYTQLSPENALSVENKSLSALALTEALQIDYEKLPVIVLTNDLNKRDFTIIRTCPEHLESQMSTIGMRSREIEKEKNLRKQRAFQTMMKEMNKCGGVTDNKSDESIARILSDFLAYIASEKSDNYIEKEISQKHANEMIQRFLGKKKKSNNANKLTKDTLNFLSFLTSKNSQESTQQTTNIEGFETESHILYNTYDQLKNVYQDLIINLSGGNITKDNVDFSPLVICLAKIFEIETNLSIIQWCRQSIGIEMPQYFKKVKIDPENSYDVMPDPNLVRDNARPINLNSGKSEWKPPAMGQSLLVAQTLNLNSNITGKIEDFTTLFSKWSSIANSRNESAHTQIITEKKFNKFLENFNEIKLKYFPTFLEIKNNLKGNTI